MMSRWFVGKQVHVDGLLTGELRRWVHHSL